MLLIIFPVVILCTIVRVHYCFKISSKTLEDDLCLFHCSIMNHLIHGCGDMLVLKQCIKFTYNFLIVGLTSLVLSKLLNLQIRYKTSQ